ncbi:MAG TPA: cupin domain-containing protein [Candidatus Limnocylindria bacterium]
MAALVNDYRDRVQFGPERFTPVPLGESARTKALLVCLEPGQFIPIHDPNVDVTFVVLEGTGTIVAGAQEAAVGPGAVSFVPAGEPRGLRSDRDRLVALHVVTPPPTAADHTKVMAGLARGSWR